MLIGDILTRKGSNVFTVGANSSLTAAVKKMVEHGIGSLIAMEASKPVGIVTERDILNTVSRRLADIQNMKVCDVMVQTLITCESSLSCADAVDRMMHNSTGHRIRHLPVVDAGVLRGMVSIGDLVETLLQEAKFENKLLKNYIRHWPENEEKV